MAAPAPESPQSRPRGGWLHRLFELSILAKAIFALAEFLTGLGLWLVEARWVVAAAHWLTRQEITEDPSDRVALWILHQAQAFDIGTQGFWAAYLIGHGAIKLAVVAGLLAGVRWAYPLSIAVLMGFIAWQIDRYVHTPSVMMLALSVFDLVVIWLIWHEYRSLPHSDTARG